MFIYFWYNYCVFIMKNIVGIVTSKLIWIWCYEVGAEQYLNIIVFI